MGLCPVGARAERRSRSVPHRTVLSLYWAVQSTVFGSSVTPESGSLLNVYTDLERQLSLFYCTTPRRVSEGITALKIESVVRPQLMHNNNKLLFHCKSSDERTNVAAVKPRAVQCLLEGPRLHYARRSSLCVGMHTVKSRRDCAAGRTKQQSGLRIALYVGFAAWCVAARPNNLRREPPHC